jgi:hypothetical protein
VDSANIFIENERNEGEEEERRKRAEPETCSYKAFAVHRAMSNVYRLAGRWIEETYTVCFHKERKNVISSNSAVVWPRFVSLKSEIYLLR